LPESRFSKTIQISFETITSYQLELAIDILRESVFVSDVVQNGIIDDEQFLIKVYLPAFVDRIQIDRTLILNDGRCGADSTRPVNLVHARMHVLDNEEKEVLIVLVELYQLKQNIQVRIT
jgi:hypothetical protein